MELILQIGRHIAQHWVEVLFAIVAAGLTKLYSNLRKNMKEDREKNKAIGDGMQALLRSEIIDKYNYYKEKGYCPIYGRENIKRLYEPYNQLGGNDVATGLVEELMKMPAEKGGKNEGNINHEVNE